MPTPDCEEFRFHPNREVSSYPTNARVIDDPKESVKASVERLAELQEKLFADNRYALLLVFQGMDAAGKDSTIKNAFSGVNPAGFQVFSFKQPSLKQLDHNYLWRYWQAMPERGRIGIFNRSYYEETLVVRVHPEIIENRQLPHKTINEAFWQSRFEDFRNLESHLDANGTKVLKFFLNVSKEEQRQRLLRRLERDDKHWKFNPSDVRERRYWDEYQHAFAETLKHTHTEDSPWYVIPADHKWTMRALVAQAIELALRALPIEYPEPADDDRLEFDSAREELLAQGR
ncbi:MAG: PPK2 family polyphosphate kinase [Pseudomonadota bacterium]